MRLGHLHLLFFTKPSSRRGHRESSRSSTVPRFTRLTSLSPAAPDPQPHVDYKQFPRSAASLAAPRHPPRLGIAAVATSPHRLAAPGSNAATLQAASGRAGEIPGQQIVAGTKQRFAHRRRQGPAGHQSAEAPTEESSERLQKDSCSPRTGVSSCETRADELKDGRTQGQRGGAPVLCAVLARAGQGGPQARGSLSSPRRTSLVPVPTVSLGNNGPFRPAKYARSLGFNMPKARMSCARTTSNECAECGKRDRIRSSERTHKFCL